MTNYKKQYLELSKQYSKLRDQYKDLEQSNMQLLDKYAEIARTLGSPSMAFYGDPAETHAQILERAKKKQS